MPHVEALATEQRRGGERNQPCCATIEIYEVKLSSLKRDDGRTSSRTCCGPRIYAADGPLCDKRAFCHLNIELLAWNSASLTIAQHGERILCSYAYDPRGEL